MTKELSPTEKQILEELLRGSCNKEIARALDIAEATVKVHMKSIFIKTGITSRLKLVVNIFNQRHAQEMEKVKGDLETLRARIT